MLSVESKPFTKLGKNEQLKAVYKSGKKFKEILLDGLFRGIIQDSRRQTTFFSLKILNSLRFPPKATTEIGQTFIEWGEINQHTHIFFLWNKKRKIICINELIQYGCYYDTIELNLLFHSQTTTAKNHKSNGLFWAFSFDWFLFLFIPVDHTYQIWCIFMRIKSIHIQDLLNVSLYSVLHFPFVWL